MTYLESFEVIKFHLENGVNNACIFHFSDRYSSTRWLIERELGFTSVNGNFDYKFRHNNQILYLFNKNDSNRFRGMRFDCCFIMPDSFPDFLTSQIACQVKDFVYLCDKGEYLFDSATEQDSFYQGREERQIGFERGK